MCPVSSVSREVSRVRRLLGQVKKYQVVDGAYAIQRCAALARFEIQSRGLRSLPGCVEWYCIRQSMQGHELERACVRNISHTPTQRTCPRNEASRPGLRRGGRVHMSRQTMEPRREANHCSVPEAWLPSDHQKADTAALFATIADSSEH